MNPGISNDLIRAIYSTQRNAVRSVYLIRDQAQRPFSACRGYAVVPYANGQNAEA
jgi:hypothetical protein